MTEAIKNFMPCTPSHGGEKRYVNMALVYEFGPPGSGTLFKDEIACGTVLTLPDTTLRVQEPPEYFLGRRIEKGGHR